MGGRGGAGPRGEATSTTSTSPTISTSSTTPDWVAPGSTPAQQALIDSYWELRQDRLSEWIRFPDIRETMSERGFGRQAQDQAISSLAVRQDTRVIPVANLKSLSPADRHAAIFLGGEDKHAMGMFK